MNMFTQRIDPITGTTEWELKDEHYDYFQEIARSSFADMLHDKERNHKYFFALKNAIDSTKAKGKKCYVLDIGTGTGLLSMMAVKCGADSVVACEAFQPISQCALKILKDNHVEHDIKIIPKRSTELSVGEDGDLKQRANILVTEVFDTELIGEGALKTFEHAHEVLLEEDCIVVPSSATIYAQIIESSLAQHWNTLKWIANSDGKILLNTPDNIKNCPGTSTSLHDLQLSQLPSHSFKTILPPTPVFHFDWTGKTPILMDRRNTQRFKASADGLAQAVFVWWDIKMDPGGTTVLSCAPYWAHPDIKTLVDKNPHKKYKQDLIPWRDHWMQAIYYLPRSIRVTKDQELTLISCHDEYSLWFNLTGDVNPNSAEYTRPECSCGFHLVHSRTRIGQINDGKRHKKYINAIEDMVDEDTVCLSLSDGSFIPLTMAKMNIKHLYCLEPNSILRNILRNYIEFNKISDKVTIVENLDHLKISTLREISLIFGEPYFTTSLLPWDNFRFKYLIDSIREHLSDDVKIVPRMATIKALAVEFLDLYKIRAPLGDCEGFIMDKFDKLIHLASTLSDFPVEPQPLWEYPGVALSRTVDLYRVDFEEDETDYRDVSGEIEILKAGACNGVALWVDWDLDGTWRNMVSTGPSMDVQLDDRICWDMNTRQGVYLMPNKKIVNTDCKLVYDISFNAEFNNFNFSFKKVKK